MRCIPNRAAAPEGPPTTHLASWSVRRICCRSVSSKVFASLLGHGASIYLDSDPFKMGYLVGLGNCLGCLCDRRRSKGDDSRSSVDSNDFAVTDVAGRIPGAHNGMKAVLSPYNGSVTQDPAKVCHQPSDVTEKRRPDRGRRLADKDRDQTEGQVFTFAI